MENKNPVAHVCNLKFKKNIDKKKSTASTAYVD